MWGQARVGNEKSSPLVQRLKLSLEWHELIEPMVWVWSEAVSLFSRKGPSGAFHGSGVCRGHAGFSWQGPPSGPRQLPAWREYSEWTHGDRSWCGRPRPSQLSFPTLCHWFPGWVTLVTLSFNLLQRAWPVVHVSWGGWEQTHGFWSPNGNYHFLFLPPLGSF